MPTLEGNKYLSIHFLLHRMCFFSIFWREYTCQSIAKGHENAYSRADIIFINKTVYHKTFHKYSKSVGIFYLSEKMKYYQQVILKISCLGRWAGICWFNDISEKWVKTKFKLGTLLVRSSYQPMVPERFRIHVQHCWERCYY